MFSKSGSETIILKITANTFSLLDTVSVSSDEVIAFFKGRCVICLHPATVTHEIEPRARGKKSMRFENRVALCNDCHDWAHLVGANKSRDTLIFARSNRIKQIYGENPPKLG